MATPKILEESYKQYGTKENYIKLYITKVVKSNMWYYKAG